jgi:hypothetical protein
MAIKSYIRGFGAYPVDTRQMISSTDAFLASAADYALSNDSFVMHLSNTHFQWEYFGSQLFCVAMYEVV